MLRSFIAFGLGLVILSSAFTARAAEPVKSDLQEPWQSQYTKENATGKHVLG